MIRWSWPQWYEDIYFLHETKPARWNKKIFFILLGRLLQKSFISYQHNVNLTKFNRQKDKNLLVKVVEGFTRNFTEAHKMPGSNLAVTQNNLLQKEFETKKFKEKEKQKQNSTVYKHEKWCSSSNVINFWTMYWGPLYWKTLVKVACKENSLVSQTDEEKFWWYFCWCIFANLYPYSLLFLSIFGKMLPLLAPDPSLHFQKQTRDFSYFNSVY